jgi:cob(I)alamin adenosyltransferase
MSPYTRTGDNGSTGLLGKDRLPKHHPRIEALGAVDEASAALGLARSLAQSPEIPPLILEIQRDIYHLMAELAASPQEAPRFRKLNRARLEWLEAQIDSLSTVVSLPNEFILPGDSPAGASLALARTVVRRAERRVVELFHTGEVDNPLPMQYLNRLSSLCFTLELYENQHAGKHTSLVKEKSSDTDN